MAVLYRKYRPQTFSEVVGQSAIIQTLKNQVKTGQVSHAYLFTGSRGIGKTTIARLLAKAVNCPKVKDGEPCGKCDVCEQIAQNNFMDLVEIDAASNTGVDNIRDLIEHVKFTPTVGKFKVFIIDEVHMLSKGAFNALLKTLEEPPAHAIFILATTEIQKVPATIISRTQRFDFKRLEKQELITHLESIAKAEKLSIAKDVLELVADLAEGGGRDALSLLDKISTLGGNISLEDTQKLLGITDIALSQELLDYILKNDAAQLPSFFGRLTASGTDFSIFNRDFLEYLRKVLVSKVAGGSQSFSLSEKSMERLKSQIALAHVADVLHYIRLFLKSYKDISGSPSPELPVLLAAIEAALKNSTPVQNPVRQNPVIAAAAPRITSNETKPEAPLQEAVVTKPEPQPEPVFETSGGAQVSMEEVQAIWEDIIEKIKAVNGPLANLVKNSHLKGCEPGRVILGVKYLFHKQNIESPKNQIVISQAIEHICGKRLRVLGEVIKEDPKPLVAPAQVLTDALQVFGGELVE